MGNYDELKQAVSDVIKTNGNQEITGQLLQNTLLSIINTVGANATFAGIATPETNPGTPDQNVFYIASKNGIYANFNGVSLNNEIVIFTNKNGNWVKNDANIAQTINAKSPLFYSLGYINANNIDNQFEVKNGNIIYKIGSDKYLVPMNTTIPYNMPIDTGIYALCLYTNEDEITFTTKNWRNVLGTDIVFAIFKINSGKVQFFEYCAILAKVDEVSIGNYGGNNFDKLAHWANQTISIDRDSNTFIIGNGDTVFYYGNTYLKIQLNEPLTCQLKEEGNPTANNRIIFNVNDNSIYPKAYQTGLKDEEIVLCCVITKYDDAPFEYIEYSGGPIYIDGIPYNTNDYRKQYIGSYIFSNGNISFDNITRKISINIGNLIIKVKGNQYTIPLNTQYDYYPFFNTTLTALIFDPINRILYGKGFQDVLQSDIVVATVVVSYESEYKVKKVYSPYVETKVIDVTEPIYEYSGNSINIISKSFQKTLLIQLSNPIPQSFAIYKDYIVGAYYSGDKAYARLFNITNGNLLAQFELPTGAFYRPHCNVCCFGNEIANVNSIAPLLYISQWDDTGDRGVLVYDIIYNENQYSISLVQTIKPIGISDEIIGAGSIDYVVDTDNDKLYSIAYYKKNGALIPQEDGNKEMICVFDLPKLSDGTDIILESDDVIDNYEFEPFNYSQDKCYNNGCIFVSSGGDGYPDWTKIRVINLKEKSIASIIPLNYYGGEPEGLDVYKGDLVINGYGGQYNVTDNIYKLNVNGKNN